MSYDDLLEEADAAGLLVKEKPLLNNNGRLKGKRIAIRQDIPTTAKKADVLAEEMGHYYTSVGRIVEQDTVESKKQERAARLWGYNKRIGLFGLVRAYNAHCETLYDMAEYLDVSEDSLIEALEYYRQIYGVKTTYGKYMIQFEPNLQVHTMMFSIE
ncbi:MAG: hypothetical protein QM657_18270 [Lacrimispora sp.]|uniref:hypothetical protein n=1 Tax=Lacrimispora sp. TaxID=2719234 RepID=UPI0039E507A0